jgi:hypothetical protein
MEVNWKQLARQRLEELKEEPTAADVVARLHREVMKPARLCPLNYSQRNGRAASDALIEAIRS